MVVKRTRVESCRTLGVYGVVSDLVVSPIKEGNLNYCDELVFF